jgi:O-antigen biosynthesis protein WbqV
MKPDALFEFLVGRSERAIDPAVAREQIEGRRVAITGAGGTIGSELARQVAALGPAHMTLINHSEFPLYQINGELGDVPRTLAVVDVREREEVCRAFENDLVDVVFHAAAMKHVPLCEENPVAAVLTNVRGTRNVIEVAERERGALVVVISTDKAVYPTCVMGATKRVAERMAAQWAGTTVVRFGNVLGSSGSVLPLFERQIEAGRALTVTHPCVNRYFMTTREAVGLTLAATRLSGARYVLDMGEPVLLADVARRLMKWRGAPRKIEFVGLRPGEKLDEDLFYDDESRCPTEVPGVLEAQGQHDADDTRAALRLRAQVMILEELAAEGRREEAVALLRELGEADL